jgi:hypothetical protein
VRTNYLLCARRILVDTNENDVSAITLLEDFTAQGFPLVLPRVALIWALSRERDEPALHTGSVKVTVDDDSPMIQGPFSVEFQDQLVTRVTLNFLNFTIAHAGTLRFHCSLENGHAGEVSSRVDQLTVGSVASTQILPAPTGPYMSP